MYGFWIVIISLKLGFGRTIDCSTYDVWHKQDHTFKEKHSELVKKLVGKKDSISYTKKSRIMPGFL